MFGVEVGRLLRTKWKSAQTLAEELFALFNPDLPLEHNGPIKLTQGTDAPPIQIFMQPGTEATNPIQIYRPDPTTGLIPTDNAGNPVGSGVGGTDLGTITFNPAPTTNSNSTPPSGLSPIMLYGSVVSGGPDNPFLVDCWARTPTSFTPIGRLTVLAAQIDSGETVPAGTKVLVIAFPASNRTIGSAYMFPPVWV